MPDIYSIIEYLQSVSFADFSWKSNSCWCLAWNYTKCYGKNQGGYLHYVSIKGFTISSSVFPNFTIFCKNYTQWLLLTSFVSADVGNQLKVKPNVMVADDALMQQCVTTHWACKVAAMLTHETSELTGPDLLPPNIMAFWTSAETAVTVLLYYFTYLHKLNLKLIFLHLLCANVTVNITKVVIKIL